MKSQHVRVFERYSNGQMDSLEKAGFEERLRQDEAFRKEFEEYNEIYESIADTEMIELRKQLRKISRGMRKEQGGGSPGGMDRKWFWLAAVLIVSLSIVSMTYLWVNSPRSVWFQGVGWVAGNPDSLLYSLEPSYEELVRYRVRSEDFHLDQPRDSLVVRKNTSIHFEWRTSLEEPVFFDVLNKSGRLVYSKVTSVNSPYVLKKNLPRGIYVYRFRTEQVTLHTGLLFIV